MFENDYNWTSALYEYKSLHKDEESDIFSILILDFVDSWACYKKTASHDFKCWNRKKILLFTSQMLKFC